MARITAHQKTTRALLTRLRDQGMTLEQCAGPKIMARSITTLKRWCRKFDIAFPDYEPRQKKAPPKMTNRFTRALINVISHERTQDIACGIAGLVVLCGIIAMLSQPLRLMP